ncbi:unnamed protein product [Soboliphyme baturini]|uniref:Nuclear pore complex protein n=1 Tax=Soboliphyme baturini TaxID=241478 RepID=A0A183IQF4_9BILA|nr:unnamed protein product [Soboliphyme baturini]
MVLKLRGDISDALRLIQREIGKGSFVKFLTEAELRMVELMMEQNMVKEVLVVTKLFLSKRPADWLLWKHCFDAAIDIVNSDPELLQKYVDEICEFIESCVADSNERCPVIRGPRLARLDFLCTVLTNVAFRGAKLPDHWNVASLLIDYFQMFASKNCCYRDLVPFIGFVSDSEKEKIFDQMSRLCGGLRVDFASGKKEDSDMTFAQNVSSSNADAYLRFAPLQCNEMSKAIAVKFGTGIQSLRTMRLPIPRGAVLPFELQYADRYILLAFWTMWDMFAMDGKPSRVWTMVALLEEAAANSPSNFAFRILLMKCYSLLGAAECIVTLCEDMDIKYIMRDTLWYLIYDQLSPFGLYEELLQWLSASSMFYSQSKKEIVDCVIQCFKSASFMKILEFFDFSRKLDNSFLNTASFISQQYFYMITDCESVDQIEGLMQRAAVQDYMKRTIDWKAFTFNMDFDVVVYYGSAELRAPIEDVNKCVTQELIDQLKFQDFVFKIFYKLCGLGVKVVAHESDTNLEAEAVANGQEDEKAKLTSLSLDEAANLLNELMRHCRACQESPVVLADAYAIAAMPRSFFNMYLSATYLDVLEYVLTVCISTMKRAMDEDKEKASCCSNQRSVLSPSSPDKLQLLMRNMFACHHLHDWFSSFPEKQLIHVSYLLQTFSVILLACEVAFQTLKKPIPQKSKKFRRKKDQVPISDESLHKKAAFHDEFQNFCNVVIQANETCCGLISDLNLILDTNGNLLKFDSSALTLEKYETLVRYKVMGSYRKSLKALRCLYTHNEIMALSLNKKIK